MLILASSDLCYKQADFQRINETVSHVIVYVMVHRDITRDVYVIVSTKFLSHFLIKYDNETITHQ